MTMQSRGYATRLAGLLLYACVAACGSDEGRARDHLEQGREYLAENRRAEARLELRSALQFDPESTQAHNGLAAIELADGNTAAALTHMQEAHRLDPTDSESALQLADILLGVDIESAEAIIDAVVEREPGNAAGYIGKSKLALVRGRTRLAAVSAKRAMELAPDDPRTDWHYGFVMQAMALEGELTGQEVDDSVRMRALASFKRYIEKGGLAPWAAEIEQARTLAAWPGFAQEAAALFRHGVERARKEGTPEDELAGLTKAAAYARSSRDNELLDWALEARLELHPYEANTWRQLAELHARTQRDPEEVWKRALAQQAENPRVHVEYARFLVFRWKLDDALAHLQAKADEGVDPPLLLNTIASTQIAAGRRKAAARTVAALEQQHPRDPRTILARAQLDLRDGDVRKAVARLTRLVDKHPDADAYRLIARAREVSGDPDAALAAIEKAIEVRRGFRYEEQRTRARLLSASGRCDEAIRQLFTIRERVSLSEADQVMLAHCQYENGQAKHARKVLEGLLAKGSPSEEAVLEYARREGHRPEAAPLARRKLERLLRRNPESWQAVTELTRMDIAAGKQSAALARLDQVVAANGEETPGRIRLLRAQVSAQVGREEGTMTDARLAFESQPRLRGAMELLVALHVRKNQIDEAVAVTEEAQRVGAFDQKRRMLLGRLYRAQGNAAKALSTFRAALLQDADDPSVYYELGLALQSLERTDEAAAAFEKALSLEPDFPEATEARRVLEGTRSVGAS